MLAILAALAASTPHSTAADTLEASVPWVEKISVTVDDKGAQQSCTYQSSLSPSGARACDKDMADSMKANGVKGPSGVFSKLTFERRFSPGGRLDSGRLQPGDKLLGQQVMFLTFAADGSIESCKLLATSGEMQLAYGCKQAQEEQFRVPASAPSTSPRQAFMTILAYGHQEQIA